MKPTVTSADRIYVDPSALRRLYVHDPHSRAFCTWRASVRGALPLTRHGRVEVVNSIALAVFRRDLTPQAGDGAIADLNDDLDRGRLVLTDVPWRAAFERATELSVVHTPKLGTRTLDVLHVASAMVLNGRVFVTYDERQAALAKAIGLRVLRPT
jgi:predicted nucleic acid-binding protein